MCRGSRMILLYFSFYLRHSSLSTGLVRNCVSHLPVRIWHQTGPYFKHNIFCVRVFSQIQVVWHRKRRLRKSYWFIYSKLRFSPESCFLRWICPKYSLAVAVLQKTHASAKLSLFRPDKSWTVRGEPWRHGPSQPMGLPCPFCVWMRFSSSLVPAQTLAPRWGKEGGQLCPRKANTKYSHNAIWKENTKKMHYYFLLGGT